MRVLYTVLAIAFLTLVTLTPASADDAIHLGLSEDVIAIDSNFNGADITVFGAVEAIGNPSQNYDIIVVLRGPNEEIVVRQKDKIAGIWVNSDARDFAKVPGSYSIATTKPLDDIAPHSAFRLLGVGIDNIDIFGPNEEGKVVRSKADEFSDAFFRLKQQKGLYLRRIGGIEFLSSALFKARIAIPANVPVGVHEVKAYAYSGGVLRSVAATQLRVEKSGFEEFTYQMAKENGLLYGLVTVALAMFAGWFASFVFRRR